MQPIKGEPTNPIVDVAVNTSFRFTFLNRPHPQSVCRAWSQFRTNPPLSVNVLIPLFYWPIHGAFLIDRSGSSTGSHQKITHELSSFIEDWLTRAISFRFCICFCFCLRIYLFSKRSSFGWWVGGIWRCHDTGCVTGKFTGHEIEWRGKMIDKPSYELDRLVLLIRQESFNIAPSCDH